MPEDEERSYLGLATFEHGALTGYDLWTPVTTIDRNRLATCADFVTGTLLSSGYDERKIDIENQVRPAATGLEACISEAASGVGPTESVSFLAAMCFAAAEGGLLGR